MEGSITSVANTSVKKTKLFWSIFIKYKFQIGQLAILHLILSFVAVINKPEEPCHFKFRLNADHKSWTHIHFVCYITNFINMVTVRSFGMYGIFSMLCVCSGVHRTTKLINKLFN